METAECEGASLKGSTSAAEEGGCTSAAEVVACVCIAHSPAGGLKISVMEDEFRAEHADAVTRAVVSPAVKGLDVRLAFQNEGMSSAIEYLGMFVVGRRVGGSGTVVGRSVGRGRGWRWWWWWWVGGWVGGGGGGGGGGNSGNRVCHKQRLQALAMLKLRHAHVEQGVVYDAQAAPCGWPLSGVDNVRQLWVMNAHDDSKCRLKRSRLSVLAR
jgi:hypothetical protein